jgi:Fur family ferric uptake transcriptional regulator
VAKIVLDSQDYPDLDQLRLRIGAVNPRISLATVYRTLRLLVGLGLVERHTFQGSRTRYGPALDQHRDHLIDVTSGRVIEFHSEEIERLQDDIARHLGFRLTGHRLELYGEPVQAPKRHSSSAAAR